MTKNFRMLFSLCLALSLPAAAQTSVVPDAPSGETMREAESVPSSRTFTAPATSAKWAELRPPVLVGGPESGNTESAAVTAKPPQPFGRVMGPGYWAVMGSMFASFAVNAEGLYNCPKCSSVPSELHRRGMLYGIGIPVNAGFTWAGYHMKKRGNHLWFLPPTLFTAANAGLAYHWHSNSK